MHICIFWVIQESVAHAIQVYSNNVACTNIISFFCLFLNIYVPFLYRDSENEKVNSVSNEEEEVDSGVDGEAGSDSPAKEEDVENAVPDKKSEEPEEGVDYEMIESVVFKGKMIKRQISVQSHSKSVADLFAVGDAVDDNGMSITGSRKVRALKIFL